MNWKEYEIYITRHFQRLFPNASIKHNVRQDGLMSKTKRQIDILIEEKLAGCDLKIIIDCKYFNKKVDVKVVESFLSFLQDLKASKGIIITNKGYTAAANNRAKYDSKDIELRIINFDDLEEYQGFTAIPYSGSHYAIVSAPEGWVIDSSTTEQQQYVASFYPVGLSRDEAFHRDGFIYLIFSHKDKNFPDLLDLLNKQKINLENKCNLVEINYQNTISRGDCSVKLRVLDTKEMNDCNTRDYTIFLDYPETIIYMTLLTPKNKEKSYLKKLEWIAQKLIKGDETVHKTNSDDKAAKIIIFKKEPKT